MGMELALQLTPNLSVTLLMLKSELFVKPPQLGIKRTGLRFVELVNIASKPLRHAPLLRTLLPLVLNHSNAALAMLVSLSEMPQLQLVKEGSRSPMESRSVQPLTMFVRVATLTLIRLRKITSVCLDL